MYGSNFWIVTRRPRSTSRRPSEAAAMPFPSEETTPPVTKTYFVELTDSPPSADGSTDRKSTRLNSSHGYISYAVFCLKKKNNNKNNLNITQQTSDVTHT